MKRLGKINPDSFLLNTISPEIRKTLPAEAQKVIEQKVEIVGSLIEKVNDEENSKATELAPSVILQTVNSDGSPLKSYNLFLTDDFSPKIGEKVKVTGYLIDKMLIPISIDAVPLTKSESINKLASANSGSQVLGVSTTGNKRVAVISITFDQNGYKESNFTRQQLADIYFSGNISTAKYLKKASLGKLNISGDINDVYEIGIGSKYSRADVCDIYESGRGEGFTKNLIDSAKTQASGRGIDWSIYEFVGFFYPFARGLCDGGPSGEEPVWGTAIARGVGNRDYGAKPYHFINGDYCKFISDMCSSQYHYAALVAHEIGHNLGLSHANGLRCTSDGTSRGTPKIIGSFSECKSYTYADRFDVIGGAWTYRPYISASNQNLFLNYMPDTNRKTVTRENVKADGIYTLYSSSETRTGVTQFMIIPRTVNGGAYYLEYRNKEYPAIGGYPESVFDGAIIRLSEVPSYKLKTTEGEWQNRSEQTYLIDMRNNRKSSWYDFTHPNLVDGQTFTDNINKINIQQVASDKVAGRVQLKITFGTPPCELDIPGLSIPERRKSNFAGQTTDYQVTITNKNSSTCENAIFDLSSTSLPGWNISFSENDINLASGDKKTLTVKLISPVTSTPDGNPYSFQLTVKNRTDNAKTLTKQIRHDIIPFGDTGNSPVPTRTSTPTPKPTNTPTPTPKPTLTARIEPTHDAVVKEDSPNTNYKSETSFWADGNPKKRLYFKFDLGFLSGRTIKTITLELKVADIKDAGSSATFGIKFVDTNSWNENTITWNNRPTIGNTRIATFSDPKREELISVDLTQQLKTKKGQVVSLTIGSEDFNGTAFYSKEASSGKPQLIIEYQ